MGRTKGGMNTKIHAVTDEAGLPVRLYVTAGNDADISHAETMAAELDGEMLVADKGYDSDESGASLKASDITPCIPSRSNRKHPQPYSKPSYRKRHVVENFFERLKNFRGVAIRYDKLAETFLGFVCRASTLVTLTS